MNVNIGPRWRHLVAPIRRWANKPCTCFACRGRPSLAPKVPTPMPKLPKAPRRSR